MRKTLTPAQRKINKALLNKNWINKNRERYNASKYHYRDRVKMEVLLYYGQGKIVCKNCGFDDIRALCLDHINNDGAEWRKNFKVAGRGNRGSNVHEALKKMGFPGGLQILCANCNLIKELDRKGQKRALNKWYKKEVGQDA